MYVVSDELLKLPLAGNLQDFMYSLGSKTKNLL